jgi:hypothetical protein
MLCLKDIPKPILAAICKAECAKRIIRHMITRHTNIPETRNLRALIIKQAQAHAEDLRLSNKSRLISKGSALVKFKYLNWNDYLKLNNLEQPNRERVEHVKQIFQKEGCS